MNTTSGLGAGFAPSALAAAQAMPNAKIVTRPHPMGAEGSKMSLEDVVRRVREGRNDPRVRGWAGRAIVAAGAKTNVAKAQAILDALRKQTVYAPDPAGTELMAAPKHTLCLDSLGLCMPAGDCDDLAIAYGSATLSVGIPTYVVGQAFGTSQATHVINAIEDERGNRLRVDATEPKFNVGDSYPATKEWFLDPMSDSNSLSGMSGTHGDYVGIGQAPSTVPSPNVIIAQAEDAVIRIEQARDSLRAALTQITQTRTLLNPTAPFDPEPYPAGTIVDASNFPQNGIWTQSMDAAAARIYDLTDHLATAGREALTGVRKLMVDPGSGSTFIESHPNDTWSFHALAQSVQNTIFGFFDSAGNLLGGINSSDGSTLTQAQAQAAAQANPQPGVQQVPQIVGLVGIVLCGLAFYYVMARQAQTAETVAKEASYQSVMSNVAAGKMTADQANQTIAQMGQNRKEEAKADPLASSLASGADIFKWVAIGGIAVAAVILVGPLVKETVAELQAHRTKSSA